MSTDLYKSLPNMEIHKGKPSLSGIRSKILYAPKSDIALWPRLDDTVDSTGVATVQSLTTYAGDFKFYAEKGFREMEIIDAKSSVTVESQGEKPSRAFLNKATFLYPGTNEEAAAFCSLSANGDFVYLVQQRDGRYRVIGNEMVQTETVPSMKLGDNATSEKGTTIEVSVVDITPAPFYDGEITQI